MKAFQFSLKLFVAVCMFSFSVWAQTSAGLISGVVQDESGAVVPGANITVKNVDTGVSRSVLTDAAGRYNVPGLIPDNYQVQAQMQGFETGVRAGIQLTVGSELAINMTLKVGQVTQKTVVTADAPLVETFSGTVSGLVDDKAMRDLPLNGRSFDQLIALQSSAPIVRYSGQGGSPMNGLAGAYTINGARGSGNMFLMDGTEMIGPATLTLTPFNALGFNAGIDAIREYTVLSSNYSASYGKRAGGIINMATRSGTNQFHGSAFEYLRNSDFDARNFFDVAPGPAPFRRNQFGAAVGGPIKKDKAFFYGDYEGLRQTLGLTDARTVPNDNYRKGLAPECPGGSLIQVPVNPASLPLLALFPRANGRDFGDGSAQAISNPA